MRFSKYHGFGYYTQDFWFNMISSNWPCNSAIIANVLKNAIIQCWRFFYYFSNALKKLKTLVISAHPLSRMAHYARTKRIVLHYNCFYTTFIHKPRLNKILNYWNLTKIQNVSFTKSKMSVLQNPKCQFYKIQNVSFT